VSEHWISIKAAADSLRITTRQLFRRLECGQYKVQDGPRSGNRKHSREILLESLPQRAQADYWAKLAAQNAHPDDKPETVTAASIAGQSEYVVEGINRRAEAMRHIESAENRHEEIRDVAKKFGKSERSIELWFEKWLASGRSTAAFIRKTRRDRARSRVADDHVIARIQSEYLQLYRPTAREIYRSIVRDYDMSGRRAPSYQTVRRICKSIPPDLRALARDGAKAFDDKFAIVTLRKKPALPRMWCAADHHLTDHIVVFKDGSIGRPWLTAIQDICTNEILGYTLSREKRSTYPGSQAIGVTLRKAILRKDDPLWPSFGLFDVFYTDLGKDFRSKYVRSVCHDLNITVRYTRGYWGRSKGSIERWFGTLESGLKKLPGYIGRSTDTNPLRQTIGAPRQWESMRGEILTVDQFAAELHRWITAEFHHTESRALKGYSPIGLLEKHINDGFTARAVTNERALDLLMMSRAGKTVGRMGIQMFSTQYEQRFFRAPELVGLVGQDVQVFWNPESIGEIIVYKDDRFICKAQNEELLGYDATEEDLAREREIKKAQKEGVRRRHEELLQQRQYPNEMARVQAEKRIANVTQQEREKIAVNAQAPSATVIIPKYYSAEKTLRAASATPVPSKKQIKDEELRSSEDLFGPEEDCAASVDEQLKSSDELFKPEDEELPSVFIKHEPNPFAEEE
jgi:putative transposase